MIMEALRFNTTVLHNGTIEIPQLSQFADCPVEVYIVIKQPATEITRHSDISFSVEQFLEKWTGFIKEIDPDKNKLEYLQKKYL